MRNPGGLQRDFNPPAPSSLKTGRELLLPSPSAARGVSEGFSSRAAVTAETRDLLPDTRYWKLTLGQALLP